MKQISIYTTPRSGVRLQIQIDSPARQELIALQKAGTPIYDLLNTFLIENGPGEALDKTEKNAPSKPIKLIYGSTAQPMLTESISPEDILIVTLLPGAVINDIFVQSAGVDVVSALMSAGRVFYQRVYTNTSPVPAE